MTFMKRIGLCLLAGAMSLSIYGCGKTSEPLPPSNTYDQPILPGMNNTDTKPATYTPVYATAFGDTIILATVPVEEWHSQKSDCPPREISNGGRVKCNGEHEYVTPITQVIILEDVIPRACCGWFRDMIHLEKIEGLENLHTHHVSDMSYMFAGCEKLETLDLSSWDVSNVTDMTDMFKDCVVLDSLPQWYTPEEAIAP